MAEYSSDKKSRDSQMRATINQQLVETGEREKLKELLRVRLTECGWRDQLKQHCKVWNFRSNVIYADMRNLSLYAAVFLTSL